LLHRITTVLALLLALGGTSVISLTTLAAPAQAKDMDCGNFSTQAQAQSYFLAHGGPSSDPDYLDADGDGIACESNPCPCSYATTTHTQPTKPTRPAPKPKKLHALTASVKRQGPAKKLVLAGKVSTFKGGRVQVLRKQAGRGYAAYRSVTASRSTGAFTGPLAYAGNAATCFKVVAPETQLYKRTEKDLGCFTR
jgi:hypothetical protein